jgi:hypothetical protein
MALLMGQTAVAPTPKKPFANNTALGMANPTDKSWQIAINQGFNFLIGL